VNVSLTFWPLEATAVGGGAAGLAGGAAGRGAAGLAGGGWAGAGAGCCEGGKRAGRQT
jgi:hypothetical protein